MGLVALDSPALVIEGFVHSPGRNLRSYCWHIRADCCGKRRCTYIRKPGFLGADIPQGHVHRAGQEYRKNRRCRSMTQSSWKMASPVMGVLPIPQGCTSFPAGRIR